MSIIIHHSLVSPPARATLIIAELLRLKVDKREVNIPAREQYKPEYLKKNPLHTVPLLEDGEFVLADSHAIITYLVAKNGGESNELYPKDVKARAMVDQRLYFDATILFPALRTVIFSLVKNRAPGVSEQQHADIINCYDVTETYLKDNSYIAAGHLTVADVSCVTTISSLNCIIPIDRKYVNLHGWWDRLKKENWYQKINAPGLSLFGGFIRQFL